MSLVHGVLGQLNVNYPDLMDIILTTHQTRPAKPNPAGHVTVAQQSTHPEILTCKESDAVCSMQIFCKQVENLFTVLKYWAS